MIKVMLIDDEPWLIKGMENILDWGKLGFEICATALDGISGLELLEQHHPQIVFLDIHMPQMNGLEVMRRIKQYDENISVVILSGYAEFAYAQKALKIGADDYLLKPADEDELLKVLNAFRQKLDRRLEQNHEVAIIEDLPDVGAIDVQVKTYIDANFTSPDISVKKISATLYVNSAYIGQAFRKSYGVSIAEYITEKRMDYAEYLLKNKPLTIEKIAEEVGIQDYFYFNKLYKKYKGLPPGKVRKG